MSAEPQGTPQGGAPLEVGTLTGDWYVEDEIFGFAQGLRVRQRITKLQTPFQRLEILESEPFGRVLILDDALQTSEWDEFMYHEMLVHVPLVTHPDPREVLIIGGGDGGTLRRVLQHPGTRPVQVEIDRAVVDACKENLPAISDGAFEHPRTRLVIGDGIEYMANNPGQFDVVIIDSTDPVGPAIPLFQEPFYRDVATALADDGLLAAQSSSPIFMKEELKAQRANLCAVFPIVRTYLGLVPGYPGGIWSYTIASKHYDPLALSSDAIAARLTRAGIQPRYYTPEVHQAAFVLPQFIAEFAG